MQSYACRLAASARAQDKKPNILVIMGDDVGWFNVGAYHRGIMSGKTPNLDKLASQGMMFTDYYAEASCTAGRANFITGELPIRTGLTTVGQAGPTSACPTRRSPLLRSSKRRAMPLVSSVRTTWATSTSTCRRLHGFDEFFGYLYHLDAMSDPYWFDYPQDWIDEETGTARFGSARWATDTDLMTPR